MRTLSNSPCLSSTLKGSIKEKFGFNIILSKCLTGVNDNYIISQK